MINWKRILSLGAAGLVATAACWCVLRAFTGIFDILNLRVFVGAILLVPVMLAPAYGFDPLILTNNDAVRIPKEVCTVIAALAVASILLGEFGASLIKGVPIPWEKFNLLFMGISVILPFQMERLFNRK